jgi:hypothetical protein
MQYKKTLNETFPKKAEQDDDDDEQDDDEGNVARDPQVGDSDSRLSPPDFKQRALSAKSHIFRKGKIESK